MGQRAEGMITLGSQYYDAEDASIDYEWAVAIVFASQACSLHYRLALCITGLLFASQALSYASTEIMGGEESKLFNVVAFASQALQIIM